MTDKKMMTLKTKDDKLIDVDFGIMTQSKLVSGMMSDLNEEESMLTEALPIPNVTSAMMTKVIEWCTQHKDDKPTEEGNETESNLPSWDANFFKVDQSVLLEIMLAANYLDIPKLLDYACMAVAGQIRGKTPEEIRKHLNIQAEN